MSNEIAKVLETNLSKETMVNFVALQRSGIKFPIGYTPENAVKSAMFELSKLKLVEQAAVNVTTHASVINAINQMLIQGLDSGKKQCYFVPFGQEVQLMRSYFGTQTLLKRLPEIEDVKAFAYYEDNIPEFEFDVNTMSMSRIKSWNPNSKSGSLAGAFAVVYKTDGKFELTNMTFEEISTAWGQGAAKGNSPAHKKFPQEMAKKTVINRACKNFINTSEQPTEFVKAFNETTANEMKEAEVIEDEIKSTNVRDYASEISAVKTLDELGIFWNHTVPDDQKEILIEAYNAKKDELFQEHLAKQQEEQIQDMEEEPVDLFENN